MGDDAGAPVAARSRHIRPQLPARLRIPHTSASHYVRPPFIKRTPAWPIGLSCCPARRNLCHVCADGSMALPMSRGYSARVRCELVHAAHTLR